MQGAPGSVRDVSAPWLRGAAATAVTAAFLIPAVSGPARAAAPASVPASVFGHGPSAKPAPQAVAKKLFRAWLRHDRHAAGRVAAADAVSTLFSYPFRAPDEFAGCSGNACRFVHTSVRVPGGLDGVLMVVSGSKVAKVYESRHVTKPSAVAKYLFEAWRKGDRYRGLEVASTKAVKTLFRVKYDPKGVTYFFQGCTPEPKGYACAYSYEGGAMSMHVRGSKSSGYEVTSISYIAD